MILEEFVGKKVEEEKTEKEKKKKTKKILFNLISLILDFIFLLSLLLLYGYYYKKSLYYEKVFKIYKGVDVSRYYKSDLRDYFFTLLIYTDFNTNYKYYKISVGQVPVPIGTKNDILYIENMKKEFTNDIEFFKAYTRSVGFFSSNADIYKIYTRFIEK